MTSARHTSVPLTGREIQILALVAAGASTQAIGERLGISENTVKTHLTSVYRKTGARNRVQAARHYLDNITGSAAVASALDASSPLIQRQIHEIEARLAELEQAAAEAKRLRRALSALQAIEQT